MDDFVNLPVPDRIYRIIHKRNPDDAKSILRKHIKDKANNYEILIDPIRQYITFKGTYEDIFELFQLTQSYAIKPVSIQYDELKFDIPLLFNKLL